MIRAILMAAMGLPLFASAISNDIRVRIQKDLSAFSLKGEGVVDIQSPLAHFILNSPRLDFHSGRIAVHDRHKSQLLGLPLTIRARTLLLNGRPISSTIRLVRGLHGADVIAYLPLEEYVAGVVPAEMPANWPTEALKAQAVAARSFAYSHILNRTDRDFDVETSYLDQEYRSGRPSLRLRNVIDQTRSLILLDERDKVMEALYHSDCGGVTENAADVWGGTAPPTSHPDCSHPTRHWSVDLDRQALALKFINYFGLGAGTKLSSIRAGSRDSSGRVKDVQIDMRLAKSGEIAVRSLSSQDFRELFGYRRIPSTNFQMSWIGSSLHLDGRGEGHGVGMCQHGARALAREGRTFDEILQFYYPNARLADLEHLDVRPPAQIAFGD